MVRSALIGVAVLVPIALGASEERSRVEERPLGLPKMRIPRSNPLRDDVVELGKMLYFDPRLSSDNSISCASCHNPAMGWSNGESFATGVGGSVGGRSSPTILNSGYSYFQFWDGRASSLEEQALGPIQNPIEMNMSLDKLEKKLNAIEGYRNRFQDVFQSDVTSENIAKAIASFERTILSGDAPYDRFKAGDDSALSDAAQRGMNLFFGKANCSACHAGPHFTDGGFHNIGIGFDGSGHSDPGRHEQSNLLGDLGSFKTPTLREIARTAPYMHDGSLATLEAVIEHYDQGGIQNPQLDEEMFRIGLSEEEKADLVTFLKEGLSSESYPMIETPKLPE